MGPGGPFPLLNSPSGQPVVELFTQALGRAPAIFFTLCGVIIMNMVAIPGAQAGSRMVFALARDELVPLARMWTRVDVKRGTPILAVWGYAVAVVIVSLLGLLSEIAIAAVFTVCAIALNVSYLLPILCKMMYPSRFERGPWHLGRWSIAVNVIAVLWNIFIAIILFLPLRLPVTPSNVSRVSLKY
jgi:Amino acid transporters